MGMNDYDIRGNPIYKQALIKYRAKLDEDDRRAWLAAEAKRKKALIELIFIGTSFFITWLIIRSRIYEFVSWLE